MSEDSVEEDNSTLAITSALYTGSSCDSEDVNQGDDNAAQPPADSSLPQAHAVSDTIFAPVRKLPPEMLAKIFIECIPSPPYFGYGMYPHQVRARLGQVCRVWNTILNDEPGVWATLAFDHPLPALEIVSLWIKKSKLHPLDVSFQLGDWFPLDMDAKNAIVKMLHRELWRIRSFFKEDIMNYHDISPLFPPDLLTEAPMMQILTLQCHIFSPEGRLGCIYCPQLHTLTLGNCDKAVESLISKPMQNLRVLTIISFYDNILYIKLLQAVPNLVSLTWHDSGQALPFYDEISRVVLRSLKSLTLRMYDLEKTMLLFRQFDISSLDHLDLECLQASNVHRGSLNTVLDVICGDGAVQLRRLTLGHCTLRGANFHAIWHHLNHLETLIISNPGSDADELLIALSSRNRDFSSVCPQLKTLELSYMEISMGVLVDFVEQRVKSDLGGPGLDLVTCLKLSNVLVDKEVSAQLARTHSSSVHLPRY